MILDPAQFFDGAARDLAAALQQGNLVRVEMLLPQVNLNQPGRDQMTLLMWAIVNKNKMGLERLLQAGANSNQRDDDGLQPVAFVANLPDADYLRLLLQNRGDPNSRSGQTPALHRATTGGQWPNVLLLLDNGADINAVNEYDETITMLFAMHNQFDKVNKLIERGADVHRKNKYGHTLMYFVREANIAQNQPMYAAWQTTSIKLQQQGMTPDQP